MNETAGIDIAEDNFVAPWDVLEDEQEYMVVMNSIFEDYYKL